MQVLVAKNGGFCFGVKNAVQAIEARIGQGKTICTLGEIIHNPSVVDDLRSRGAYPVNSVSEIPDNAIAVIRSHGVGINIYDEIKERGLEIIDATCPFVIRIHDTVKQNFDKGKQIIIVGKRNHPEVQGINGWCDNSAFIVSDSHDAEQLSGLNDVCIVAQTTISPKTYGEIIEIIEPKCRSCDIHNTICSTTETRQKEAIEIAKKSNLVIVIGGKNSSNTQELYKICQKHCINTFCIENSVDIATISLEKIGSNDIIGVVAGASTPDWMIREVVWIMSDPKVDDIQNNELSQEKEVDTAKNAVDQVEETAREAVTQTEDVVKETKDAESKANDEFLEGIEKALVRIRSGQVITGTVVQVNEEEVCVNIGYKSDGFIKRNELSVNPDDNPSDIVQPGDEIEVEVIKVNDGDSIVLLSRKRVLEKKFWDQLIVDRDNNVEFTGICKEVVKGGVIANINGIRTFVPASHLSLKYVENLQQYVGEELRLRIIEVDKQKRRVVASQKLILQEEFEATKKELWSSLEEGATIHGIVRRITDFGAFVDIGGIDGLLHVTDLSWQRVRHPSDIVSIGQEVDVQILSVDSEKERVSLGLKQLQPDPWTLTAQKYAAGSIIEGKVVRIVTFGAFVSVEPGIDGLIHISQVATNRINKVEDELSVGDIVKVKVLDVDAKAKRISLSRKQVLLAEQAKEETIATDEVLGFDTEDMDIPSIQQGAVTLGDKYPDLLSDALDDEDEE